MATFEATKKALNEAYARLTQKGTLTGGRAYITVSNAEFPFLHGVEFAVLPPTKRFQTMEKLSGGEKAIASLALLFSLHSSKPPPFFILDEVDANLDSGNVELLVEYVRKRSLAGTQCIVISLKDTFFSRAESLIGVYNNIEAASSSTLALDLTSYT